MKNTKVTPWTKIYVANGRSMTQKAAKRELLGIMTGKTVSKHGLKSLRPSTVEFVESLIRVINTKEL